MKVLLFAFLLACAATLAGAATPLIVADGPLGLAGARVHPNLLLNLSLTFIDAGAAYRGGYDRATEYGGYFNPRMCYRYPVKRKSASVTEPDLDERTGHFSLAKPADARHECGGHTFSGNFLNWASASTLDLLRMGLTGGDRVIDEPGLTVLQRAWLPDGKAHPDFYASTAHFPRRVLVTAEEGSAPHRVTPFDTGTLYVVSCRNRILFSQSAKGSSCDAPRYDRGGRRIVSDKYFGEFNARVEVCAAADAANRPGLCQHYASGFKPEGSIQRHSGDARIGLMSYLTEQGADDGNLYGGVLRAPLKFVGDTSFDAPQFAAAHNRRAEWSAQTGVLMANPDQASGAVSGTINYINQLGRVRPGAYKTADPGAELYYESLRYLQGREPSPVAGSGASDAGFPVWKSRADPVTASCQRNAIATIGHASFIEDRYLPGNTRADHKDTARSADVFAPAGAFDVMRAARRVGEMEADAGGAYANPAPRPDLLKLDLRDNGPAGAGSYYLAGAAYWAHTNAIRPDKPVRADSYALELGEAAAPGGSPLYLAAKYGAFEDRNGDGNPFITSPGRMPQSEWSTDGKTPAAYFPANDPRQVADGARALFAAALAPRGRVPGAPVIASRQPEGSFVVQASYEQGSWNGGLQRIAMSSGANGAIDIASAPAWDAGVVLSGNAAAKPATPPRPLPAARKIYTSIRKPDQSTSTVPFTWDKLARDERTFLDASPSSGVPDGLGEARTAYLRGDRTRELGQRDGVFRRRAGVLGDAIHSAPLLVGAATPSIQDSGYQGFYARHKSRATVVYLGTNDGMLHAFDARDGAELFAYVPNALLPALNQLTDPAYRHRPYVDGSAGYGEAALNGTWKTVLVSGMGMGAHGVFALDISDPAAFETGAGALWEFTDRDDPAMGHVLGAPHVAKLKVGMKGLVPEYRYFAVITSGINNYDHARSSADGALFLLALDKPASARWKEGVNYFKLAAPASEAGQANALAAPTLVTGADGGSLYAYAGDLQGQMWRFDFSGKPPWSVRPLFTARDAQNQRQPITHPPKAVFAPGGGYLVLFGTGKFIEHADLQAENFAPQSFYAIHDSGQGQVRGRSELAARTFSGSGPYAITGVEFSFGGAIAKKGWYFDFPQARTEGERLADSPTLASGTVFINTLVTGSDACTAPASRTYVLDALSGFAFKADGVAASGAVSGELAQGGEALAPVLFDSLTTVGPRGATGGASAVRSIAIVHWQGEGKAPDVQRVTVTLPAKRISWREVANWQELHDAAIRK